MSTSPIVAAMMKEAVESAATPARERAAFAQRLRGENMQVTLGDGAAWIVECDGGLLDNPAISMRQMADGRFVFRPRLPDDPFIIRSRRRSNLWQLIA